MEIIAQGHLVKVRVNGEPPKHGVHRRAKITTFTRKSRKRLIDMVARFRKIDKAIFITLTYGQKWPDMEESKRHLKNFLQRIRDNYPQASGIWRLEFQERGAPHYHLLLFNLPFWKKEDVAAAWLQTIGDEFGDWSSGECRAPFTRIELINGLKHALAYVSKYIAKEGKSGMRPGDCGFNYAPYSQKPYTGRFWGILNVDDMPFGELFKIAFRTLAIAEDIRFHAYFSQNDPRKHPARAYIKKPFIKPDGDSSFSFFTDDINEWVCFLRKLLLEHTPSELSYLARR